MFETGYSIGVYRAAAAAAYQVNGEILPSDHGKLSLVVREPLGVVSVISPWNFPLILSSRGFAVALAVGNTVVLKPSEETPVSGGLLIAEILEEAGIPMMIGLMCSAPHVGILTVKGGTQDWALATWRSLMPPDRRSQS